ncbi:MAG: hypothetical protein ABSG43_02335 [Solirubrobacteraceae bacterium]|jgi:hypothetical protein
MYPTEATPALYALLTATSARRHSAALAFCRERGVLGVGWGGGSQPLDWEDYQALVTARDGAVHAAVREIHDLADGSLIWTHDCADGAYWLAKVTGPWEYLYGAQAEAHDVRNVRPVQIVACVAASQVPAAIVGRFTGWWVIQRIFDEHAARRSAAVFAELTAPPGEHQLTLDEVLTTYLDDRDVQQLVSGYLQRRYGYLVRPWVRRPGLAGWEYVLRDGHGREALVRARRGFSCVPRDPGSLPSRAVDLVYVFSPTGTYGPNPAANVVELEYDEIVAFMRHGCWSTSPAVTGWLDRARATVAL